MQVCVPFQVADALLFDPDIVPTVSQLLEEYAEERSRRDALGEGPIAKGQVRVACS